MEVRVVDTKEGYNQWASTDDIRPRGFPHSFSEYVLAIRDANLVIEDVREFSGSETLARNYPKMEKYIGWPMLIAFTLKPAQ